MKTEIIAMVACGLSAVPVYANTAHCGTPEEAILHCVTDKPECCPVISSGIGEPEPLSEGDLEED